MVLSFGTLACQIVGLLVSLGTSVPFYPLKSGRVMSCWNFSISTYVLQSGITSQSDVGRYVIPFHPCFTVVPRK